MRTRHAGRQLVRQHGYARIISLSEFGDLALPGWLDPEAEWTSYDAAPERQKSGHFGIDFAAFWAKKGTKTAKNGPKSASSGYLSVSYVFLYSTNSFRLTSN
jgi:hypothetical protein